MVDPLPAQRRRPAPVVTRLQTYGLPAPASATAYMARVLASPGVAAWVRDALEEKHFLASAEPYRKAR